MRTHIDPIRYIQNSSSGKLGAEIAHALREALPNATQTTILGPVDSMVSSAFESVSIVHPYVTPHDYEALLMREFPKCDLFISCAAVLDFEIETAAEKISRHELEQNAELRLPKKNVRDFVALMGNEFKQSHQKILAFSLDTGSEAKAVQRAKVKISSKKADWIFVNFASDRQGPDKSLSEGVILNANGDIEAKIPEMNKREVAKALVNFLVPRL